jgi:hypothetical protein
MENAPIMSGKTALTASSKVAPPRICAAIASTIIRESENSW